MQTKNLIVHKNPGLKNQQISDVAQYFRYGTTSASSLVERILVRI